MRKTIFSSIGITVVCALSFVGVQLQKTENETFSQSLANIQALSQPEGESGGGLDCSYSRATRLCEFYVGAKAKVEVFGKGIITAGADGYIKLDGEVVCSRPGNETCTPFECYQFTYRVLDNERS